MAVRLGRFLVGTHEEKRGKKYLNCANYLGFRLKTKEDGTEVPKLAIANFCRDPFCPICIAGRSRARQRQVVKALPAMIADRPDVKYLMVTLTVKNCPVTELRKTIQWMHKAFVKLMQHPSVPQLGYIRAVEVTKPDDYLGYAHPHFHILLAVSPEYFNYKKDLYIGQDKLSRLWGEVLGVDYNPIVHIKRVKVFRNGNLPLALGEIVKYCTKSTDLLADRQWTLIYMSEILGLKRITTGGLFRQYLKILEAEPEDLIGKDDTDDLATVLIFVRWDFRYRDYVIDKICEHSTTKLSIFPTKTPQY